MLRRLLDHLAETLTLERETVIEDLHRRALSWEPVERLPLVMHYPAPSDRFPPYPYAETLDDPAKMLFNELVSASLASASGRSICHRAEVDDDLPCTIRPNFGCVLIPSLFGARIEQVGDSPPWVRNFESREAFVAALDSSAEHNTAAIVSRVVEQYAFYREALAAYPNLERIIKLVLPDLQGPLNNVEQLRGSEVYVDFHADPELVDRALTTVAEAQIAVACQLAPWITDGPAGWSHQHGFRIPGNILVRADSAIMLSPQMYRRQVAPHDERVLHAVEGGGVHSCGRIDHCAGEFLDLPSLKCLDLGQPKLNDLDALYAAARRRRVPLIRVSVAEAELISGSVLRRFPTGVSLSYTAKSIDEARRIMSDYKRAAEITKPKDAVA
jgi:hypothetical protein